MSLRIVPSVLALALLGCGPGEVRLRPAKTCDGGNLEECRTRCDQNEARACYRLGWFHEEGQEIERNVSTALGLYQKACDANMAIACRALGMIYARGDGVEPNAGKAKESFQRACALGLPASCEPELEIASAKGADQKIEASASGDVELGVEVKSPEAPKGPAAPEAPQAPAVEAPQAPTVQAPQAPQPPTPAAPTP